MQLFIIRFLILVLPFTALYSIQQNKSIIVGAFSTDKAASLAIKSLQKIVKKQPEIARLKYSTKFDYYVKKSGRYHIVLIKPFKNKNNLKKVLFVVKKMYPDAYVKTIKTIETSKPKPKPKYTASTEKIEVPVKKVEIQKIKIEEKKKPILDSEIKIKEPATVIVQPAKMNSKVDKNSEKSYLSIYLITISILSIFGLFIIYKKLYKKNPKNRLILIED